MKKEIKLYEKPVDLVLYPKRETEIYNALKTEFINKKLEIDLHNLFKKEITRAYVISSFTPPEPNSFAMIVDQTMKTYKDRFGFLREGEIELIFTRGLSKEYGEFMGLSFITFVDWAKAYSKDLVRIKLTTPVQERKNPTDDELYTIKKTNALSALNEFNKNETCGRYGEVVYDFFCELGLLDLSQEEKNEYWALAKQSYLNYLLVEKTRVFNMEDKKRIEKDVEAMNAGGKKGRLIAISKRLIVDDFFKSLVFDGGNLQNLIEPK